MIFIIAILLIFFVWISMDPNTNDNGVRRTLPDYSTNISIPIRPIASINPKNERNIVTRKTILKEPMTGKKTNKKVSFNNSVNQLKIDKDNNKNHNIVPINDGEKQ